MHSKCEAYTGNASEHNHCPTLVQRSLLQEALKFLSVNTALEEGQVRRQARWKKAKS